MNLKKLKPTSSNYLSQKIWRYLRNFLPASVWTIFYILFQKINKKKILRDLQMKNLDFKGFVKKDFIHSIISKKKKISDNGKISKILKKNFSVKPDNGYLDYLDETLLIYKKAKTVLEIGIAYGNSINSYLQYFNYAEIIGIDIDPQTFIKNDRVKCFYADQLKKSSLDHVSKKINKYYDVIIDDGWHHPQAQINCMTYFLPYLKPGGIMIVEDIVNKHYSKIFFDVQKILFGKNFITRYINFSKCGFEDPYGMSAILEIKRKV